MRAGLLIAVGVAIALQAAHAQPSPMRIHYDAYSAAFARGDLATAETEAALALTASEAQHGDGGTTGVLALNLATTKLLRGDAAGALPIARRSLALAQTGARGVDPNRAELIVRRAELAVEGQPGAVRLLALLTGPAVSTLPPDEIYAAASELGTWAMDQRSYNMAGGAWSVAAAHGAGSPLGEVYGKARAQTWQAAAIIADDIGANGRGHVNLGRAAEALALLTEAGGTLLPLAQEDGPGGQLTLAQRAYAETRVWRSALNTKLAAQGDELPSRDTPEADAFIEDAFIEIGPARLGAPRCRMAWETLPLRYPRRPLEQNQMASVVVRLRLDAAGAIVESTTAARIGDEEFARALEAATRAGRLKRHAEAADGCRMPTTVFMPFNFRIEYVD